MAEADRELGPPSSGASAAEGGGPGTLLAMQTLGTELSCLLLMGLCRMMPPTATEAWPPARHSTAHAAEWGSCDGSGLGPL